MKKAGEYPRKIKNYNKLKSQMAEFHDSKVARLNDVSRERIRQLREKYGINTPDKQVCHIVSIKDGELGEIIQMLKKHTPLTKIAKDMGRSPTTIINTLKRNGINTKEYSLHHGNLKTEFYPDFKKVKKLIEKGWRNIEIHHETGIEYWKIACWKSRFKIRPLKIAQ